MPSVAGTPGFSLKETAAWRAKVSLTGIYLSQAAVAVAGLAISNEYSTGMITLSLTAMPRRLTWFLAGARPSSSTRPSPGAYSRSANLTCDFTEQARDNCDQSATDRLIGFTHLGPSGSVTTSAYSDSAPNVLR